MKAVSPWLGLQTIPFAIKLARTGPNDVAALFSFWAISPDRCGPAPNSAMALRYLRSDGVVRSRRTLKKLSSNVAKGKMGVKGKMAVRYKLPLSEMASMGCGGTKLVVGSAS